MFDLVREDLRRARQASCAVAPPAGKGRLWLVGHPGVMAVLIYRYGSWAYKVRIPLVRQILIAAHWILWIFQLLACQCNIAPQAEIGPGFVIENWGGVMIPPVKAGRNLLVSSGAVIGHAVQSIGDNVSFAEGAKAFGPIKIGNNVSLGVNAVVTSDVPDNSTILSPASRVVSQALFRFRKAEAQGENGEPSYAAKVHSQSGKL